MRCVYLIDAAGTRCPEKAVRGYSLCLTHLNQEAGPPEGSQAWVEGMARGILEHRDETDEDETLLAGKMLIAALFDGPSAAKIAKRIGEPRADCRRVARRLRENGIWKGEAMCIDDWAGEEGHPIAFVLHALAGAGLVVVIDDGKKWKRADV